MGHVIGDVTNDATTVDVAVGVLVDLAMALLAGLAVGVMLEEVACVVVDAVCTACIILLKSIIAVDDLVSVHTVRDIDPDEPSNMLFFCAVDWTQ